jgi:hypothetical protein
MPRLSLYRPEKGNDFRFIDRAIEEQFQVGGTDVFVHKYLGPVNPADGTASPGVPTQSNPLGELGIQDVILMENRDRHYAPDVYVMRGIYQMQDLDFNLSQFGIFLNNDNIFIHFHLRNCVETLERKIMAGDVIELPHLKDEYALDDASVALKRFYVVQDVTRAANGFSQTWYPHLLRVKCVPLVDSQEYSEILGADAGAGNGTTIGDLLSTYNQNIAINEAIVAQAEEDAPLSGYDTKQLYVLPQNPDGTLNLQDTSIDTQSEDASNDGHHVDASYVYKSPDSNFYVGYLTGDGKPPNGAPYTFGISFPTGEIIEGQFHLRTDYFPNRLFRFNGTHWMKYEDNVRMTLSNNYNANVPNRDSTTSTYTTLNRQTQRTSFINNNNTATIAGEVVQERQALSKVLKPKADN